MTSKHDWDLREIRWHREFGRPIKSESAKALYREQLEDARIDQALADEERLEDRRSASA